MCEEEIELLCLLKVAKQDLVREYDYVLEASNKKRYKELLSCVRSRLT